MSEVENINEVLCNTDRRGGHLIQLIVHMTHGFTPEEGGRDHRQPLTDIPSQVWRQAERKKVAMGTAGVDGFRQG